MHRQLKNSDMNIREQAAQWLCELEDAGPDTHAELAAWLRASPRHVEEFLLFQAMWKEFKGVDRQKQIDVSELLAQASAQGASTVVPLQRARDRVFRKRKIDRRSIAAGTAVLALGTAGAAYFISSYSPTYSTATGEQRTVKLDDGSFVYLNTGSRIQIRFSGQARDIHLLEGEALFDVRADSTRPFRVDADGTVIRVVGTRFNVYRRKDAVSVAVIQGKVKIDRAELAAGEEADVAADGQVTRRARPDIEQAAAWRTRRLVFRSESLETVAAEFNRYNVRKIRIEGDAVRTRQLIGTFNADDPESLIEFLARETDLSVGSTGDEFVIRGKRPPD